MKHENFKLKFIANVKRHFDILEIHLLHLTSNSDAFILVVNISSATVHYTSHYEKIVV